MDKSVPEPMLQEKYEALLSGLVPSEFQDHILFDKLSLLTKQNSCLEKTILSLRHELSTLIGNQRQSKVFAPISDSLKKTLECSDLEASQFNDLHLRAVEALKCSSKGFSMLFEKMKSKLFPPNKEILEFTASVLDQVQEIRSQLGCIHGYMIALENNEKMLRDAVHEKTSRSQSVSRVDQFERPETIVTKKYTKTLTVDSSKNSIDLKGEDPQGKISALKIALGKMKNQRDLMEIDNQKLLLQLKQAKEQLALCEENAAAKEVVYKNKLKKLNGVISDLKKHQID